MSSELASRAPSGEARRFTPYRERDRELFARTVLCFGGVQLYPPRQTIDVAMIAPPQSFDIRYSPRWWEADAKRQEEAEAKRVEYLEEAAIAREQFCP